MHGNLYRREILCYLVKENINSRDFLRGQILVKKCSLKQCFKHSI